MALTIVAALALLPVSVASAYVDHWFSGNLGARTGYASHEAHSLYYIEGDTNAPHFCVAPEQGDGEYHPSVNRAGQVCSPDNDFAAGNYYPQCCYHADIDNFRFDTLFVNSGTHYDF